MLFAVASLLLALVASSPVDVKGKWEGKVISQREDGTRNENAALLILDQKDGAVTGTVGADETDRHPVTSGTIEGNTLTLHAKHAENGREFHIELTVEGDEMKGTIKSGERTAEVVVKKIKNE